MVIVASGSNKKPKRCFRTPFDPITAIYMGAEFSVETFMAQWSRKDFSQLKLKRSTPKDYGTVRRTYWRLEAFKWRGVYVVPKYTIPLPKTGKYFKPPRTTIRLFFDNLCIVMISNIYYPDNLIYEYQLGAVITFIYYNKFLLSIIHQCLSDC